MHWIQRRLLWANLLLLFWISQISGMAIITIHISSINLTKPIGSKLYFSLERKEFHVEKAILIASKEEAERDFHMKVSMPIRIELNYSLFESNLLAFTLKTGIWNWRKTINKLEKNGEILNRTFTYDIHNKVNGTKLIVAVKIIATCQNNWIGADCDEHCDPKQAKSGNYTCNVAKGHKECLPGLSCQLSNCDNQQCRQQGGVCVSVRNQAQCEFRNLPISSSTFSATPNPISRRTTTISGIQPSTTAAVKSWHEEHAIPLHVDPCGIGVPCVRGTCVQNRHIPQGYQCLCPEGYEGEKCTETVELCGRHACQHGNCDSRNGQSPRCRCYVGYVGQFCEYHIKPCRGNNPCANDGECFELVMPTTGERYMHCKCPGNFNGLLCQHYSLCYSTTCNNGFCEKVNHTVNEWSCSCPRGFSGMSCEIRDKVLANFNATPPPTGGNANTPSKFTLPTSMPPTTMIAPAQGQQFCQFCVQNHTAECIQSQYGGKCNCKPSFYGTHCEYQDHCAAEDSVCLHGGICSNTVNGFLCKCPQYYYGEFCEKAIRHDSCDSKPCQNGGDCRYLRPSLEPTGLANYHFQCSCKGNFGGSLCQKANPCKNGATHKYDESTNGSVCHCAPGHTGTFCSIPLPCYANYVGAPCGEENRGTCQPSPRDSLQLHCECPAGWKGGWCNEDIDECSLFGSAAACANGGVCVNQPGNYICNCPTQFEGDFCQFSKQKKSQPGEGVSYVLLIVLPWVLVIALLNLLLGLFICRLKVCRRRTSRAIFVSEMESTNSSIVMPLQDEIKECQKLMK